ncbi:MAG: hypothetical protein HYR76_08445 [Ignavibacteria bacterium]|nr:hypothetical protein [Ignavibacteria bacterium]
MNLRTVGFLLLVTCTVIPSQIYSQTESDSPKIFGGSSKSTTSVIQRKGTADKPKESPVDTSPRTSVPSYLKCCSDSLNKIITDLKIKLALDSLTLVKDFKTNEEYSRRARYAFGAFFAWLLLVVIYYIWAIHRYVHNYGLSNREWKILYPEAYESSVDRLFDQVVKGRFGFKTFAQIRSDLIAAKSDQVISETRSADQTEAPAITPFSEPPKNPYESDSFGLPPGTIRGTLALTALVMFLLIEAVNLSSPIDLEKHYNGLITALEMVLAFYFGSRAVEALRAGRSASPPSATKVEPASPATPSTPSSPAPTKESLPPSTPSVPPSPSQEDPPNERPAIASLASDIRVTNILETAKDVLGKIIPISQKIPIEMPLASRVLALTASFETSLGYPDCFGSVAGNFDGQGISFGALQWNLGQGSLQPLWKAMRDDSKRNDTLKKIMGDLYDEFVKMLDSSKDEQVEWAKNIQLTKVVNNRTIWYLVDKWKNALNALGKSSEMIALQVKTTEVRYEIALDNCRRFELLTERGVALMFDINVQNGKVDKNGAGEKIRHDYLAIPSTLSEDEAQVRKMIIIANRRSEVVPSQWQADVRNRKLTIANGRGTVHGKQYDLEKEFAISLNRVPALGSQGAFT